MVVKENSVFKQLGNTTVAAAGVAGVLGVGGIVGSQYYEDQRVPQQYAETAKREVRAIQKASNQYRMEYGAWPSSIAELKASPHYNGVEVSPYGSEYEFTIDGDVFTIGLEAASARHAAQLTGELQTASRNNLRVSSSLNPPPDSVIQSYHVARKNLPCSPECNTLESDLNVNGNDINNLNVLDAQNVEFEQFQADSGETETLSVEQELLIGSGSRLTTSGTDLVVDSANTQFTGNVRLGGELDAGSNDIRNVGNLDAVDVQAVSAAITEAEIDRLSGNELTYAVAVVQSLSGNELNYNEAFLRELEADQMAFKTFAADVVNVLAARIDRADIEEVTAQLVSAQQHTTNNLEVTDTATINRGVFGIVEAIEVVSQIVTAQRVEATEVLSDVYNTVNLDVTGKATLNRVEAPKAVIQYAELVDFYASNFEVDGTLTVNGEANVDTANVSGKTTTNELESDTSSLGEASAESMNVSGTASANRVTAQTGDFSGNVDVGNATGDTARFNRFISDVFEGGRFYGDNFITPITSTNNNLRLLEEYEAEWEHCVNQGNCK
jgi:hypothetical protein|tara:strand:+ start:42757 stop:44418 length:1662 start_codon:yes stop_codon:yes gene_type:complete